MRSNIERRYTYGHWVHSENSGASSLGIFDLELTYDANSAIKTLKRTGKQNTSGTYDIIDDLTYSYSGGRLQDVTDHAAKTVYDGAFNFTDNTINTHGGASDYAYNANGALTRDYNKGISSITYDQFGNPFKVTYGNKSSIEYVYSADGVKLKARHITAIPQGTGSSSSSTNYIMSKDSTDYIGDFIYHNNRFSRYNWGNGYVAPLGNSYTYRFYIRDHQGNNRLVTTSTGTVKQTTHYYPDGVTHDKSTGQGEQVYKYNGKELDRMHGLDWYDYGAREYDPTIGQFISMDPLCEKYYNVSPYAYCAGNPVRYVDPDGRDIWELYTNGNIVWKEKSDTHQLYALDRNGNRTSSITIKDRYILDGLTMGRKGTDANYVVTQSAEVGKVFLFAADNSNVEWSLQGFADGNSRDYVLGTSHKPNAVSSTLGKGDGFSESNCVFDIHSHPSFKDDVRGASGGDLGPNNLYGDMKNIVNQYNRLGNKTPRHYVYHRNTKTLYQYTPWRSDIKITTFIGLNINITKFWGQVK